MSRTRRAMLVAMLAAMVVAASLTGATLAGAATAKGPSPRTSVEEVSRGVMCPTCDTTLDRSESPSAERMRAYIQAKVDQGWTKRQIEDGLVAQYGGDESILAAPRAHGIGLLAWLIPAAVATVLLLTGVLLIWRWRRRQSTRSSSSSTTAPSSMP